MVALPSLPIGRHPEHSRWFEGRGRAVARNTSAEHYGAIINFEFNMRRYLDALERDGLNSTRVFSGEYVEPPGTFGIRRNTLGPAPGRFLAPWVRGAEPGEGDSGAKFDLECLSVPYLQWLREFIAEAPRRAKPAFPYPEALVCHLVRALKEFDNLVDEMQSEPWADTVRHGAVIHPWWTEHSGWPNAVQIPIAESVAWQRAIAAIIRDEERRLPRRHMIAQNMRSCSTFTTRCPKRWGGTAACTVRSDATRPA